MDSKYDYFWSDLHKQFQFLGSNLNSRSSDDLQRSLPIVPSTQASSATCAAVI